MDTLADVDREPGAGGPDCQTASASSTLMGALSLPDTMADRPNSMPVAPTACSGAPCDDTREMVRPLRTTAAGGGRGGRGAGAGVETARLLDVHGTGGAGDTAMSSMNTPASPVKVSVPPEKVQSAVCVPNDNVLFTELLKSTSEPATGVNGVNGGERCKRGNCTVNVAPEVMESTGDAFESAVWRQLTP